MPVTSKLKVVFYVSDVTNDRRLADWSQISFDAIDGIVSGEDVHAVGAKISSHIASLVQTGPSSLEIKPERAEPNDSPVAV